MKSVLVVVSEYGYWGEELVGPLEMLDKAGIGTVLVTPTGKRPHALPVSMDSTYIDPPLGKTVVPGEIADKVKKLEAGDRLNSPLDLSKLMPERPYTSSRYYLREIEEYYSRLEEAEKKLTEYSALLLVGGSGAIVDIANNQRVHDLVLAFVKMDKPVAAECYGVAALAFARDPRIRKSIINGRHVTGHPIEYDYKNGTGFLGVDFNMGPPPYPLEYILRDAVGTEGQFYGNFGKETSVTVDYPFVTARSNQCSYELGEKLVDVLENGLRRYGW